MNTMNEDQFCGCLHNAVSYLKIMARASGDGALFLGAVRAMLEDPDSPVYGPLAVDLEE